MKLVGIVAEYNPFHAGHRYHIAQTRRAFGECTVAVAMSGNFVQRGDCAVMDKWSRAAAALEGGADLVLEVPTVWACASAEQFAWGAVSILRMAGAQALSFGSECADASALARAAAVLDTPAFGARLRAHLGRGVSFAVCRQAAAEELLDASAAACLARANDNLAVEYLKAAARMGWAPEVAVVRRVGAGHDGGAHPEYPSASYLRQSIYSGVYPAANPAGLCYNERGALSLLRALPEEAFAALPDSGEGLSHRLYEAVRRGESLEEIYALTKTKRYAHARIRRMVLWACLGLRMSDRPPVPPYLRVLGANRRGRAALRAVSPAVPLITKPVHGKGLPLLEAEARCTDFFSLCRRDCVSPCGLEWIQSPIMTEKD